MTPFWSDPPRAVAMPSGAKPAFKDAGVKSALTNALDHLLHERRSALAAEESCIADLARHNALMRWRGLAPALDLHA